MCLQGRCLGGLGTGPLEALAPGFSTEIDPFSEPDAFVVARFLHETGFKHVRERDAAGWTPICYAVLKLGSPCGTLLPFSWGSGFPYEVTNQKKGALIIVFLLGY